MLTNLLGEDQHIWRSNTEKSVLSYIKYKHHNELTHLKLFNYLAVPCRSLLVTLNI